MPYVEILAPALPTAQRQIAVNRVTAGVIDAFAVDIDTVTIFFIPVAPDEYAHAGQIGPQGRAQRVLVKVHAFGRALPQRRHAATTLTAGLVEAYGIPAEDIAVYFFDRHPDQVAHAGRMACD